MDLIARWGLYRRDIEDWERKPLANQTWTNLRPFIQEAYQRHLTSGTITSTQNGYPQSNRFAGLVTNKDSDDNTADTITGTIHLHMANFTAQTTATLNEHATQMNASLQQLAADTFQLHQQQQAIMNQMTMMSLGGAYQGAAEWSHYNKSHTHHHNHRSTNPQHYPNINKGTTICLRNLEGVDAWQDATVDAVAAGADTHMDEAAHRNPYHMLEVHSYSRTFKEECGKDNTLPAKCIRTKQSGTQTRTCATCAASMSKIGTRG